MQNHRDMNLVLSSDPKPRLKWSPELHRRFVEAVAHLGGADKATPKSLMRAMGITGLTLYHLKSHLQKYRLGKTQQPQNSNGSQNHSMNESMKISEALEIQMEVQKRLHEQIEVQRHLQLRIEAQGKYLQRVLRRAQETIEGYGYCSEALEEAKAELAELASMVGSGYQSSSLSEVTDSTELSFKGVERDELRETRMGSIESSVTSSEEAPAARMKKKKRKEQRSSVSEGDYKRLASHRMIDLNDAELGEAKMGKGSQLIEYL